MLPITVRNCEFALPLRAGVLTAKGLRKELREEGFYRNPELAILWYAS